MAIHLYDEALVNKIKNWLIDDSIKVLRPDEMSRLMRIRADEGNDKPISLPMIGLSRDAEIQILNTNKKNLSYNGVTVKMISNETGEEIHKDKVFKLNAIPIRLGYQLDIYTRSMIEADEYVRNFVFNFINEPNLKIEIPYNGCNLEEESTVYLESAVQDNSDIPQRLFPDQFVRFSIRLVVDNAYLWSVPTKESIVIESVDTCIKDGDIIEKN